MPECVAGVAAMSEVVGAHGDEGAAAKLKNIFHQLQELAWLEEGNVTTVALSDAEFSVLALDAALNKFCGTLGQRVHNYWQPQHVAPAVPMELNGKKALAERLRNSKQGVGDGKNMCLQVTHCTPCR